jgi:hypothetical protein
MLIGKQTWRSEEVGQVQYFDIEASNAGVSIVALAPRLTTGSLSAQEIDLQIEDMKRDLDLVAALAKDAVKKLREEPLTDE